MKKLDINIKRNDSKDSRVGFRIPKDLKEDIDKICKHNNITITDYFIYLAKKDIEMRK